MNEITIALLSGLAGMMGWGISDFFAKTIIAKIGSIKTAIALQIFGAAALMIVLAASGVEVPDLNQTAVIQLFGLAALNAIGYLLLYKAFEKGTLSVTSPIAASSCGVSVLICYFFFQEPMGAKKAAGLFCIFAGILITSVDIDEIKNTWKTGALRQGVAEALGVMLVMGLWFPLWAAFMKGKDFVFWSTFLKIVMGVLMMGYYLLKSSTRELFSSYVFAGPTVIVVALIDVFAYLAVSYGFHATQNQTSLITVLAHAYSIPTLFLAYLILNERIAGIQKSGIAMILLGIFLSTYGQN